MTELLVKKRHTKSYIGWPGTLINSAGETFELCYTYPDNDNAAVYRDELEEEHKMLRSGGKYWLAPTKT